MVPRSPAERQRLHRARRKAGAAMPTCNGCGATLRLDQREIPNRQGVPLCWRCWLMTPDGRSYERERRKQARAADPAKARAQSREQVRRFRSKSTRTDDPTTEGAEL